jgi:Secretion system C-terminal sorting domain
MKKLFTKTILLFALTCSLLTNTSCNQNNGAEAEKEEHDAYDNPDKAIEFEIERTKDPSTGRVPWDKLLVALEETETAKSSSFTESTTALNWIERGPDRDVSGPSGNSRPNGDVTAGRIRAVMVDSLDPTKKTVWAGGVAGGLWKSIDITTSPANWILVNDFLSNLAVSAICQDPRVGNQNNMYFCTGESYGNLGSVRGVGVFKSTDAGATWNVLPSTTGFTSGTRIVCDNSGNIYLGTRGAGLLRSTNGGTSWTNITPAGVGANICDLEISSTGRLHVVMGIFSAQTYRNTDIPATASTAAGWNAPLTPFATFNNRAEITVLGNTLYACPADAGYQVPTIYKSIDGGDNWTATAGQPATGWASGQGWYAISAGINPANANECIVGGLDTYKTTNGGNSWTRISTWVGFTGQYVHADQHNLQWWDGGNKLMFACDGGIHFSSNGGTTIRDRNIGLRLKQFYSVAMHPTTTNHFLAGAQDNGMHLLTGTGLNSSVEVTGGDGAYTAIDQDQPLFQFGAYVYNQYRRSTNGGTAWSSVNFSSSVGRFINPFEYANTENIIYAAHAAGQYLRWDNPQTGNTNNLIPIADFGGGQVSAIHASPYTLNRVYFGVGNSRIVRVDDANSAAPTSTIITPTGATGYPNCVVTGSSDQDLLACYSSYGVTNVWRSTNGGTSWTACDGNLPDMPVRWALVHPDDDTKAFIATETGVWETDLLNGSSTVWAPSPTFPSVSTHMIKYRASDRTIAAATHGRGVWSSTIPPNSCVPVSISQNPTNTTVCANATASFSVTAATASTGPFTYQWQVSVASGPFTPITGANSATYSFTATIAQNGNQYRCIVTGNCAPLTATSTAATLTVNAIPTISTQPLNTVICVGANTSFSLAGANISSYKWQYSTDGGANYIDVPNAAPYSGVLTATLSITNATASMNNYKYKVVLLNSTCPLTSSDATLTVNIPAAIVTQPANQSACTGLTATFNSLASGAGVTYQWQSATAVGGPYTNILGATNASYTTGPVTIATPAFYQVIATTTTCASTATSNVATLAISSTATIGLQPLAQIACAPAAASFTASATGTGITYQWQVSTIAVPTYTNISGATSATYNTGTTSASMNGNMYRVIVTGSCNAVTSNAVLLTVNTAATVVTNPTPVTICNNASATFTASASGTGATYQWQVSTLAVPTFTDILGATNVTYTTPLTTPSMNGNQYRLKITTTTCAAIVNTNAALLTVNTVAVIGTQPLAQSACIPQTATFNVGATGTGLTYQWQVALAATPTVFTDIIGATNPSFTTASSVLTMNGNLYRVNILSTCSPTTPTTSNAVLLTVNNPVSITQQPVAQSGCAMDNYTFSVTAVSPGNTLTYQWQTSANGNPGTFINIGSANAASYSINPAALFLNGTYYRVFISVPCGTGISTDTSAAVKLTLSNKASIVLTLPQTSNLNGAINQGLFSTVSPLGNYSYEWKRNGLNIPNTTTSTFIPLKIDSYGSYQVTLNDALTGCKSLSNTVIIDASNSDNLTLGRIFTYPNPVTSVLFLRFNTNYLASRGTNVNLYNADGAKVYTKAYDLTNSYGVMNIDMAKYTKGLYFIRLMDASGKVLASTKVIKQ